MKTHLFIHATYAVNNFQDLASLVLELIGEKSILMEMVLRLQQSEMLDCIHVVTSDQACDDLIIQELDRIRDLDMKIPVDLVKISSDTPYCISESNRFVSSDLLYKEPHYGFYSADCLLKFATSNQLNLALICSAEDMPLLEPSTVDDIVQRYSKKGVAYGCSTRNEINILAVPVAELSAKLVACQYKRNNRLQEESARIKDSMDELLLTNPSVERAKVEREKLNAAKKYFSRPIHCREILDKYYEGKLFGVSCEQSRKYEFYPVHSLRQLDTLRTFNEQYESLKLATYSHACGMFNQSIYPSILEIEVTSRCNLSCPECPNTVLTRPKQDMESKVYRSIIDQFAGMVPMVVLSGYGEPTIHSELIDFISYAKQKQVMRVCLETNGTNLTEPYIEQLIDARLDILVVNLDALDVIAKPNQAFYSDIIIERIRAVKEKKSSPFPYIAVQTVNRASRQKQVDYYYTRWEYILEATAIQSFNDFCSTFEKKDYINMTPETAVMFCQKTSNNLVVLSDGTPSLCRQMFEGYYENNEKDLMQYWINHFVKGGSYAFCAECTQKSFKDLFVTPNVNQVLKSKFDRKIYSELIEEKLEEANAFFNTKQYDKALLCWQEVLPVYPDNQGIHDKLNELEDLMV